jgi:HAE1 family hydrophobic/amphiphilic exporter-1
LQRTDHVVRKVEQIIQNTPGVKYCTTAVGFNLLSLVTNTYSAFFFVSLEEWGKRTRRNTKR